MPKAYSYIRFSTPEQLKGDSLRRQREQSEEYAKTHGLELDTTLNLRDLGVSAYDKSNITRGALGEFLKLVQSKAIPIGSYLLVESLDRLSRAHVMDAFEVFLSILNAGITIVTVGDGMEYSRETVNKNPSQLFVSIGIMCRATDESATKSKRIRQAWETKRTRLGEKRLTQRCPAWIRPTEGPTGFELIPDRAEVVRRIFQMAKDGAGNATIVKRLNQDKVPPFPSYAKTKTPRKTEGWYGSYIQKIFENRATYGVFQPCIKREGKTIPAGDPVENYYPAVVTKEDWLLLDSMRKQRRTRGGIKKGENLSNLFSGLLKCGYCGGTMVMGGCTKKTKGEKKKHKYVACSTARRGLGCVYKQWEYTDLEERLLSFCRSVDFGNIISKPTHSRQLLEDVEKALLKADDDIASNVTKKTNFIALIEREGGSVPKVVLEHLSDLEAQTEQLESLRADLQRQITLLSEEISSSSSQHKTIIDLINQLSSLTGTSLHDLRIRTSAQIHKHVTEIWLYPLGRVLTNDRKTRLLKTMVDAGVPPDEMDDIFEFMNGESKSEHRSLFIYFKNGDSVLYQGGRVTASTKTELGKPMLLRHFAQGNDDAVLDSSFATP